jgi:hypothetical protein
MQLLNRLNSWTYNDVPNAIDRIALITRAALALPLQRDVGQIVCGHPV